MVRTSQWLALNCLLLVLAAASGCGRKVEQGRLENSAAEKQAGAIATQFIAALNAQDRSVARNTIVLPFHYRQQGYELDPHAEEDQAFQANAPVDLIAATDAALPALLDALMQLETPIVRDVYPPPADVLYVEFLQGVEEQWRELEIHVFSSESGDLQHHILVGINVESGGVSAVYSD